MRSEYVGFGRPTGRRFFRIFSLTNYRVFQETTTSWCPDREEHGYYLTPLFKCSTNPRVATAHRWNAVDVGAELDKSSGVLSLHS